MGEVARGEGRERPRAVIVLAAGQGTRMKSELPKALHRLCRQPLLAYALRTALALEPRRLLVVAGYREELVREAFPGWPVEWASQPQQLGTGHAAAVACERLGQFDGSVAITVGDAPFLKPDTLERAFAEHEQSSAVATVVTGIVDDPSGLGRILRDREGRVRAIVEEGDALPEEKAIHEVNSGCYVFDRRALVRALKRITPENTQQEYYLTDVVALLVNDGETVISLVAEDPREVFGINSRADLAAAHRVLQEETVSALMADGVTVVDPATTCIDPQARVGPDTVIEPFCILEGALEVGPGCHIGPYSHLIGRRAVGPPGQESPELPTLEAGARVSRGTLHLEQGEPAATSELPTS